MITEFTAGARGQFLHDRPEDRRDHVLDPLTHRRCGRQRAGSHVGAVVDQGHGGEALERVRHAGRLTAAEIGPGAVDDRPTRTLQIALDHEGQAQQAEPTGLHRVVLHLPGVGDQLR